MKNRGRQDFQMKTLKENQQINRLQILTLNFNLFLFLFFASLASTTATAVLWGSYLSAISGSFCAVCVTLTIRVVRSGWFFVFRAKAVSDNSVFGYTSLNDSSNRNVKTNKHPEVHIPDKALKTWNAIVEVYGCYNFIFRSTHGGKTFFYKLSFQNLVDLLWGSPKKWFTLSDIAEGLGLPKRHYALKVNKRYGKTYKGMVRLWLSSLEKRGLLVKKTEGKKVFYRLNDESSAAKILSTFLEASKKHKEAQESDPDAN